MSSCSAASAGTRSPGVSRAPSARCRSPRWLWTTSRAATSSGRRHPTVMTDPSIRSTRTSATARNSSRMSDIVARLRNPFKINRTLTICNGIFSRGVFGAVRCLTDASVREENERYLADRFPDGEFAILLRVPVVTNETLSPDLQNPDSRLYRVAPDQDAGGERVCDRGAKRSLKRVTQRTSHAHLSQDVSRIARAAGEVEERAPRRHHRAGLQAGVLPPAGHRPGGLAWMFRSSCCAASRPGSSRWPSG